MKLHRFAVVAASVTWVLLIVGALVHGTGSSLACPDWPLCHGQFFPEMKHGVEYEHTHRLVAGSVSLLTITLSVLLLLDKRYASLKKLAIAAPLMVLVQALLGGLTVLFKLPTAITLSHLTLSMCFFSVMIVIAIRTRFERGIVGEMNGWKGLRGALALTFVLVLGQIFLGGLVRHRMAGLACLTFPDCFGHYWPPDSSSAFGERIHMLHRFGAVTVATFVIVNSVRVYRASKGVPSLRRLAAIAPIVVLVQATLGVLSVTSLLQLHTTTAHLACGALVLASVVAMWTLLPLASTNPGRVLAPAPALEKKTASDVAVAT